MKDHSECKRQFFQLSRAWCADASLRESDFSLVPYEIDSDDNDCRSFWETYEGVIGKKKSNILVKQTNIISKG